MSLDRDCHRTFLERPQGHGEHHSATEAGRGQALPAVGCLKEERMDQTNMKSETLKSNEKQETAGHIRHIARVHLVRLAWLALTVVAVLLLTFLVRHLTASDGFFVEQQVNVIAVIAGLVVVGIVYTVGIVRMLRKIRAWEREGKTTLANWGLFGLGITPLLMALPIVLAFLIH